MSYPVSRHEQEITVAANSRYTLPLGNADYIRFHTVPSGVMVRINGGTSGAFIQDETHQAEPGSGELREVSFENTTGGALAVRAIFGLGKIDVSGSATISGVLPLPSGASTDALQTTGNATLAALAATTVETPDLVTLGASADQTFTGCKRVSVLNTNTGSEDVTINFAGGASRTLPAGRGASFVVTKPLATLASVRVRTTGSGSALVTTMT